MLDQEQIEHFITHGFLHLEGAFDCSSGSLAHTWVKDTWKRNGLDEDDQQTWPLGKIHMPSTEFVAIQDISPMTVDAIADLCGGKERINHEHLRWSNAFIANYGMGRDQAWQAPGPQVGGWHKDGDFFRHFLDSPEQALLTIIVFSDIGPKGGGTFIAPDSIKHVAKFLRDRPAGFSPYDFTDSGLIDQCQEFLEVTGKAGDVVLMHPYMLHASSFNHSDTARFIINPCCSFKEPMCFHRTDGSHYSPVEQAVLHGLGVDYLDFEITAERERLVPGRLQYQAELLEKEKERMKA